MKPPQLKFLKEISVKHLRQVTSNIRHAMVHNDPKRFKKITSDLWEFRVNCEGLKYRLLAFWHKTTSGRPRVIITHGFIKKTDKISRYELKRAMEIRKQHLSQRHL